MGSSRQRTLFRSVDSGLARVTASRTGVPRRPGPRHFSRRTSSCTCAGCAAPGGRPRGPPSGGYIPAERIRPSSTFGPPAGTVAQCQARDARRPAPWAGLKGGSAAYVKTTATGRCYGLSGVAGTGINGLQLPRTR